MTTRAAIYARVSSAGQRDAHTIENQLRTLPAFVASQGWTLVDTYVDDGRSANTGKLEKREGFARLARDAEARRFDVLVVIDIDRLTRTSDSIERAAILGPFQRARIDIVTPSGGRLDLDSFIGGLYVELQARFAAEENRKRIERTLSGKGRALAEGRKAQGPTPYGLRYDKESHAWSIDLVRGPALREIFERVVAGDSAKTITEDFNARGVPASRRLWERGQIHRLVHSRHAIGEWTADRTKRIVVQVPSIVDRKLWLDAQAALIENRRRPLMSHTLHVYLLDRSFARCGACGSPLHVRRDRMGTIYVCRRRRSGLDASARCRAPFLSTQEADQRVWESIRGELADPSLATRLAAELRERSAEEHDWTGDLAGYRRHLARLETAEGAIVGRFRRGLISERVFDGELASIAKERTAIEQQAVTAERAVVTAVTSQKRVGDVAEVVAELGELAATATPEERRELARLFIEAGSCRFEGKSIRFTMLVRRFAAQSGDQVNGPCRRTRHDGADQFSLKIPKVA